LILEKQPAVFIPGGDPGEFSLYFLFTNYLSFHFPIIKTHAEGPVRNIDRFFRCDQDFFQEQIGIQILVLTGFNDPDPAADPF
jgi:hypothetical protein